MIDRNAIIFPKRIHANKILRDRKEKFERDVDPEFTKRRRSAEARKELKQIENEIAGFGL